MAGPPLGRMSRGARPFPGRSGPEERGIGSGLHLPHWGSGLHLPHGIREPEFHSEVAVCSPSAPRANPAVVQSRGGARLLLEAAQPVGALGEGDRQHVDRHLPVQADVAGAVDLPHAARADWRDDLLRPEAGAGGEGHFKRILSSPCHPERSERSRPSGNERGNGYGLLFPPASSKPSRRAPVEAFGARRREVESSDRLREKESAPFSRCTVQTAFWRIP